MRKYLLACVFVAAAGQSSAQTAPDPDRLKAAQGVEQAMGGDAAVTKSFTAMRPALINMLVQMNHMPASNATEMVDTVLLPDLKTHQPEIEAARARIYAEHFTVAELNGIKDFYTSSTGQKFLAEQPAIATESMQSMQPFLRDVMTHAAAVAQKQGAGGAPK